MQKFEYAMLLNLNERMYQKGAISLEEKNNIQRQIIEDYNRR